MPPCTLPALWNIPAPPVCLPFQLSNSNSANPQLFMLLLEGVSLVLPLSIQLMNMSLILNSQLLVLICDLPLEVLQLSFQTGGCSIADPHFFSPPLKAVLLVLPDSLQLTSMSLTLSSELLILTRKLLLEVLQLSLQTCHCSIPVIPQLVLL